LGAAWANPGATRNLQLEKPFDYRWPGPLAVYFQIHTGSIKSLQVVEFLRHLKRHLPGKMLVIWDGAPIHRSLLVKNYVAATKGRIVVERLPAYAPELNPVEYMWGHLKTHEIANLIATKAWELSLEATAALRRMRRRRLVIAACYTQAELWL
jgi:transposase